MGSTTIEATSRRETPASGRNHKTCSNNTARSSAVRMPYHRAVAVHALVFIASWGSDGHAANGRRGRTSWPASSGRRRKRSFRSLYSSLSLFHVRYSPLSAGYYTGSYQDHPYHHCCAWRTRQVHNNHPLSARVLHGASGSFAGEVDHPERDRDRAPRQQGEGGGGGRRSLHDDEAPAGWVRRAVTTPGGTLRFSA
jgi:hypothetical protein